MILTFILLFVLIGVVIVSYYCVAQIIIIMKKKYRKAWVRIGSPGLVRSGKISSNKFQNMLLWDQKNIPRDQKIDFYRNVIRFCGFLDALLIVSIIMNLVLWL